MFFKQKFSRVLDIEKSEAQFREQMKDVPLEKNDLPAMILAALLTFIPAIAVVVLIFLAVIWFFFLRG